MRFNGHPEEELTRVDRQRPTVQKLPPSDTGWEHFRRLLFLWLLCLLDNSAWQDHDPFDTRCQIASGIFSHQKSNFHCTRTLQLPTKIKDFMIMIYRVHYLLQSKSPSLSHSALGFR